jgi:hypothetical protein
VRVGAATRWTGTAWNSLVPGWRRRRRDHNANRNVQREWTASSPRAASLLAVFPGVSGVGHHLFTGA